MLCISDLTTLLQAVWLLGTEHPQHGKIDDALNVLETELPLFLTRGIDKTPLIPTKLSAVPRGWDNGRSSGRGSSMKIEMHLGLDMISVFLSVINF